MSLISALGRWSSRPAYTQPKFKANKESIARSCLKNYTLVEMGKIERTERAWSSERARTNTSNGEEDFERVCKPKMPVRQHLKDSDVRAPETEEKRDQRSRWDEKVVRVGWMQKMHLLGREGSNLSWS